MFGAEGGTHDGTQLLPLKWGVSGMLLGAMARHDGPEPCRVGQPAAPPADSRGGGGEGEWREEGRGSREVRARG